MKGRYNGCRMTIYGTILPGAISAARSAFLVDKLTERAKYKIKVLDWYRTHGNNNSLTARHFGISRMTLYHWIKRFKHLDIIRLNEKSRKPKRLRQPATNWQTVIRIVQLREQYPSWSKYKIKALLKKKALKYQIAQ